MDIKITKLNTAATPNLMDIYETSPLADGRKLIVDCGGHTVSKLDRQTGMVERVAGSGAMGMGDGKTMASKFENPQGALVVGDLIYVTGQPSACLQQAMHWLPCLRQIASTAAFAAWT